MGASVAQRQAAANSAEFWRVPITRYRPGECGSVSSWSCAAAGRADSHLPMGRRGAS
eukprot:SAG11_NODE_26857_length_340_cov_0.381743_1_plen_56_part_01